MARILVVEDNDDVAALFISILEETGHAVDRSATADEAAIGAAHFPYDLVLMDFLLRGSSGVVAALALRGLGFAGPIIHITGVADPVDQMVYDRANFAGKLLKPVKLQELVDEVARQLPPAPSAGDVAETEAKAAAGKGG